MRRAPGRDAKRLEKNDGIVALYLNNVPLLKGERPERESKTLGKLCEVI